MPIYNPQKFATILNWISVFLLIWLVIFGVLPWQSLGYLGAFILIGLGLLSHKS